MTLETERTYKLLQMSTKICRNCKHFQQAECPHGPSPGDPEYTSFKWSSISSCKMWTPNLTADEALQILTWRKLAEQDS